MATGPRASIRYGRVTALQKERRRAAGLAGRVSWQIRHKRVLNRSARNCATVWVESPSNRLSLWPRNIMGVRADSRHATEIVCGICWCTIFFLKIHKSTHRLLQGCQKNLRLAIAFDDLIALDMIRFASNR